MKVISLSCPECGGKLDDIKIADGKKDLFCNFCGNHILLEDENYKIVEHRTVDEVKLRQLEFEKEKYEREAKNRKYLLIAGVAFMILGVITLIIMVSIGIEHYEIGMVSLLFIALGSGCFSQLDNQNKSK